MKQTSKTKIEKRKNRKSNTYLVKSILLLKKNNLDLAKEISKPKRLIKVFNLSDLDNIDGDIVVAGKVLSEGELTKKKKIVALSFSKKARDKISEVNGVAVDLFDELKTNPSLKGLKLVK